MKLFALLALAVVVLEASVAAPAGMAAAAPAARGGMDATSVILRLAPDLTANAALGSAGLTGIADLDDRLAAIGALKVAPALRFPPVADNESGRRLRRYLRVDCPAGSDAESVRAVLAMSTAVEHVEPAGSLRPASVPDDPMYPDQWEHHNLGQAVSDDGSRVGTPDADADIDLAWDLTTGSSAVIIAIVDTGVDLAHPEFAGRLVAGYDFVNDDADASDDAGHGTMVAGIAAAQGNNTLGLAGAAWGSRIMPIKVMRADGLGDAGWTAEGVVWAADHGARIQVISMQTLDDFDVLEDACAYAVAANAALFCAAGNAGLPHAAYPALYGATIAVGALSPCNERKTGDSCDGEYWWSSNYGDSGLILCPGVRLTTTDGVGSGGWYAGDYNTAFSGTSAAAAYAGAVGALVLSRNPNLTPDALEYRLTHASRDMAQPGWDAETGWGRLDAHLAVLSAFDQPVYVDAAYVGFGQGTLHEPYDTLREGLGEIWEGDTLVVYAGAYPENLTITTPMTIIGKDGIVRIGN